MTAIRTNPRKTKPSWLEFPCSVCTAYEEDESPLDPLTKALWNNQKIPDGNRCRFNPLLADAYEKDKCPYKHLIGQTIVVMYCDFCGKEFEYLEPTDPRLEELIKNPMHKDICNECKNKKDKDLNEVRVINVLTNKLG